MMLEFKQNQTDAEIIVTLTEHVTLSQPYYLFVFVHVLTKERVAFIKSVLDDLSGHQGRYNQFILNPSVLFAGKDPGEWHYWVYEQESTSNTNENLSTGLLETGKLMLRRAVEFQHTKYHSETSFKTYNG